MSVLRSVSAWMHRCAMAVSGWWSRATVEDREHELHEWPDEKKIAVEYEASDLGAVGFYLCTFVIRSVPVSDVERMLPRHLKCGAQSLTRAGTHPVFLMFGAQRRVRPNWLKRGGMNYGEFIVSLPHIEWRDRREAYEGPFIFMPRLFLNSWMAILLGLFYGFAKRPARMTAGRFTYRVRSWLWGKKILEGNFEARGEVVKPETLPMFIEVGETFRQPFAARTLIGPYLCSVFDFMLEHAMIQPVACRGSVERAFVPGMPVGEFACEGINTERLGGFHVWLPWTLSTPLGPGDLRPGTPEVVVVSRDPRSRKGAVVVGSGGRGDAS